MIEENLTQEEVENLIKQELGVLLYFSTPTCNVCHALKPKIIEAFNENFPEIKQHFIDASLSPEIPASMGIFSVPTIVVYLDGKEFTRESRNISVGELIQKITRPYEMMTS